MPCYHPITAWPSAGGMTFKFRPGAGLGKEIKLPCGRCIGCKLERSRQWAVRCMHENQLHEFSAMLNFTYNEDTVPLQLQHDDFQRFMKRLRKKKAVFDTTTWQMVPRYMMCGEYGELTLRPHYHAIMFGVHFPDRYLWKQSTSGHPLYRSDELEKLWGHGMVTIGEVTFESAAYVARYITKKITGEAAERHYERIDGDTGEVINAQKEYAAMSLKPGIGKRWIEQYIRDVYPHDHVIVNGHPAKPPRYYDKHMKEINEEIEMKIKIERKKKAEMNSADNTKERLATKEQVAAAALKLKRSQLK